MTKGLKLLGALRAIILQKVPEEQLSSKRHIPAFLHLGTLDSTSALHLGSISYNEITNKKHTIVRVWHQIDRGHVYSTGARARRQNTPS